MQDNMYILRRCRSLMTKHYTTRWQLADAVIEILIAGQSNNLARYITANSIEDIATETELPWMIYQVVDYYQRHGALDFLYAYLTTVGKEE